MHAAPPLQVQAPEEQVFVVPEHSLFDVHVVEVRTSTVKSKPKRRGTTSGRTRTWKKAIVQVREGESIPIFQGLQALDA